MADFLGFPALDPPAMLDQLLLVCAAYLAVGALFTARGTVASELPGWRGHAATACATLVVSALWPLLAWYGARTRLRRFLGDRGYD